MTSASFGNDANDDTARQVRALILNTTDGAVAAFAWTANCDASRQFAVALLNELHLRTASVLMLSSWRS